MIVLSTAHLRVETNVDRGAEIVFLGRPGGSNALAYDDWSTPLRASRSVTYGSTMLDWHSEYRGGWQELFPNAGDECTVGGVPLPYHGEVSCTRWDIVSQSPDRVVLRAASRLPLVLQRDLHLDASAPVLTIEETVTNQSARAVEYIWCHHPAFAVAGGSRIDLPGAAIHVDASFDPDLSDLAPGAHGRWPLAPGKGGEDVDLSVVPDRPLERFCYLLNLEAGWAAVRHPATARGIAMAWDVDTFPLAWFWQEIGGPDFPWYGRTRITAIEPCCAWPADGLAGAIARGQAHRLAGGGRASTWLTASLFDASDRPVVGVDRDGTVQQGQGYDG